MNVMAVIAVVTITSIVLAAKLNIFGLSFIGRFVLIYVGFIIGLVVIAAYLVVCTRHGKS
jgi:hydrogenase maturation factor